MPPLYCSVLDALCFRFVRPCVRPFGRSRQIYSFDTLGDMNWLDFKVKRSKVKVVTRNGHLKGHEYNKNSLSGILAAFELMKLNVAVLCVSLNDESYTLLSNGSFFTFVLVQAYSYGPLNSEYCISTKCTYRCLGFKQCPRGDTPNSIRTKVTHSGS